MSEILVLGAGPTGLCTAMLLARAGHRVTVLERDAAAPTGDAEGLFTAWRRPGVAQFHHLHFALGRWAELMSAELPEALAAVTALGAAQVDLLGAVPGGPLPGDERLRAVTARRPVLEAGLAAAAEHWPGVTLRRGVRVSALVVRGAAHVAGVRTDAGEEVRADLVVDACGRHTPIPAFLVQAGIRPPSERLEEQGFVYYTRHFRSRDGRTPEVDGPLLRLFHGYCALTLPCDNGTWGVGLVSAAADATLTGLRDPDAWMRAARLVPELDGWLDGEPLTGVQLMRLPRDRYSRLVVDGEPVCTGLTTVGDAWATTSPAFGRGVAMGLMHAVVLRDVLREVTPSDPVEFALAADAATETRLTPWHEATRAQHGHRVAEVMADLAGRTYRTDDPAWSLSCALYAAALKDPEMLRAYVSIAHLFAAPPEVFARPGVRDRVLALGAGAPRYPADAPRHEELVAAVASSPPARPAPAGPARHAAAGAGAARHAAVGAGAARRAAAGSDTVRTSR
ncbi:FAD-dependent oxidoreductase [Microbacterium sp.]|uniref:FAD-dependent oxidoreductase n=1 Tax=Microbacterium sp. TaxID=51671 RepID=UPI0039E33DEF